MSRREEANLERYLAGEDELLSHEVAHVRLLSAPSKEWQALTERSSLTGCQFLRYSSNGQPVRFVFLRQRARSPTYYQASHFLRLIDLPVDVRVSVTSTNLDESARSTLIDSIQLERNKKVYAWSIPALVVLAANDLIKQNTDDEETCYLAATFAAALKLWQLTTKEDDHQAEWTRTVAILDSIGVNASLLGPNFYRQIRQKFITRNILKWDSNAQTELAMVDAGWIAEACRTVGRYIVRSLISDFSSESEMSKLTLFAVDSHSACRSVLKPDISESVQLITHSPSLALCLRLDQALDSIENDFGVRTLLKSWLCRSFRSLYALSAYLFLMVWSLL